MKPFCVSEYEIRSQSLIKQDICIERVHGFKLIEAGRDMKSEAERSGTLNSALTLCDLQGSMASLQQSAVLPNESNRLSFTQLSIASEAFGLEINSKLHRIQNCSRACLTITLYFAIQNCLQARPGEATI